MLVSYGKDFFPQNLPKQHPEQRVARDRPGLEIALEVAWAKGGRWSLGTLGWRFRRRRWAQVASRGGRRISEMRLLSFKGKTFWFATTAEQALMGAEKRESEVFGRLGFLISRDWSDECEDKVED
ncbi:uncharacterized protein A4U43_C10F10440 [Asparagus officinalis]|uniref:Uncharacterized protein n=1 Tax=Asparagus officinalis TaxID=4686 RepID=A0A5P1E1V5_ASPOF|nr:uncharacterized protein A4U43_C10F10440 [Asparagus officinalis]